MTAKMTKAEAGRLGGLITKARHGKEHFKTIGEIGAQVFHERYRLEPAGTSDFAIVERSTSKVISYLSGRAV